MTIWEAIQDAKNRRQGADHVSNVTPGVIAAGTSLGAGLLGRLLTKGDFYHGDQISMRQAADLARRAGLEVSTEIRSGRGDNAYYRSPGKNRRSGFPIGRHGAIGRVSSSGMVERIPVATAAHEIGHGLAWTGKAGVLQKLISRMREPGRSGATIGSLLGLFKGTIGQKSLEEREKWLNLASITGGVGMAPTLADEAFASRNALKLLRSLPPTVFEKEIAKNALPRLARAFGTYGLGALGLVLGPQIAKRYYQKQYER